MLRQQEDSQICGLVGIASANLIATDKNLFTSLLYLDELRGDHSTGVCAVSRDGSSHVYKKALKASDFIQIKGYANILSKADKVLMGHNRYATMGARDDNNAHPFTHNHITLVHNGTLKSKHTINTCDSVFNTDSETISYALSTDDTIEVLERLEGAYALVWYDQDDKVLHFARNEERPLFIGKIGADLVWASEKAMLDLVAEHHKKELKDVEMLPIGQLRMYDVDDLKAGPTTLSFTPHRAPVYVPPASNYYSGNNRSVPRYTRKNIVQTIEATLVNVRNNGYIEAIADDGSTVSGNVTGNAAIIKLQVAAAASKRISATIASETSKYAKPKGYITHYFVTGSSVEIVEEAANEEEVADSGTKKKCSLCHSSTVQGLDEMEYHYGEYYHTSCLDGSRWLNDNYGERY